MVPVRRCQDPDKASRVLDSPWLSVSSDLALPAKDPASLSGEGRGACRSEVTPAIWLAGDLAIFEAALNMKCRNGATTHPQHGQAIEADDWFGPTQPDPRQSCPATSRAIGCSF